MAVRVGSARSDENRKAYGGKAGDQTGREVSTQDWYLHEKGWRVFRAKEATVAEAIAHAMEAACANKHIGYDQHQRDTLYTEAARFGYDPARVTKDVETDCSALVRVCCAYAGILGLPSDFRTGNMPANLKGTGAFVELAETRYTDKPDYLMRGDILVTKTNGHTVVVLSNGPKAELPTPVKKLGDRALKKGMTGEDVRELQTGLMKLGYKLPKYGADGDYGSETIKAVNKFKKANGLKVDGIFGKKAVAAIKAALNA